MWWLVALAVVVGAVGVLIEGRWTSTTGGISPTRLGLGLGVVLLAIAMTGVLIGVDYQPPPEQRGVGVQIDQLDDPPPSRGRDRGLTLSMSVTISECGEPVEVQLTLAPTAEFWIDNHEALSSRATVHFAIPDDLSADTPVREAIHGLEAWTRSDGLAPFVTAVPAERTAERLAPAAVKATKATFVTVDVPHWGVTLNPLTIRFLADWTRHRSFLGGCYLSLPALAGLPTVLGTAQLAGDAVESRAALDDDDTFNLFVVSNEEAGLYADYEETYEVTRGVTSLELGDNVLQDDALFPAPNASFGDAPAWTCHTSVPKSIRYGGLEPGADADDVFALLEGIEDDGTMSLSDGRQAELLAQSTCASFVAVAPDSAGTRRDLLLIAVGAVITLGIELLLSGMHRRRSNVHPSRSSG